ncbi:MAG: RluA family pseudouridine synthase [Spirochaetota bacterium]
MERKAETRVGLEEDGVPLLAWLVRRFTYFACEGWEREIAASRIAIDGKIASVSRKLAAGERVSYHPEDLGEPEVDGNFRVIHDDGAFLVVDKPANLPMHPGGRYFNNTLWALLRAEYGHLHALTRLDRETSGLVLLARPGPAQAQGQTLLDSGSLAKEYLVIVHGIFPETINAKGFLVLDEASAVRKKRRFVSGSGVEGESGARSESAETSFTLLSRAVNHHAGPLSLLRASPRSGRNHQIRATLLSLGFPVVGDKLYGLDECLFLRLTQGTLDEADRQQLVLPAQALHAESLTLIDLKGRVQKFRLPPPATWAQAGFGTLP